MRLPECMRRQMIRLLECDAAERAQTSAELDSLSADYASRRCLKPCMTG